MAYNFILQITPAGIKHLLLSLLNQYMYQLLYILVKDYMYNCTCNYIDACKAILVRL